ncbi:hypothetical protein A4U49_04350 [Acidithiobacillus ferrivorans]|nr:hypothetical protein A4U49_04350 [Acidithiobacillus ferrivorans]
MSEVNEPFSSQAFMPDFSTIPPHGGTSQAARESQQTMAELPSSPPAFVSASEHRGDEETLGDLYRKHLGQMFNAELQDRLNRIDASVADVVRKFNLVTTAMEQTESSINRIQLATNAFVDAMNTQKTQMVSGSTDFVKGLVDASATEKQIIFTLAESMQSPVKKLEYIIEDHEQQVANFTQMTEKLWLKVLILGFLGGVTGTLLTSLVILH